MNNFVLQLVCFNKDSKIEYLLRLNTKNKGYLSKIMNII